MQTAAIIVWVYGALVLIGGVMGWVKARSKPSLISGVVFGAALILTGFWMPVGRWIAAGLAAALAVVMGVRYAQTKKVMPSGVMTALSAVVLVVLLLVR